MPQHVSESVRYDRQLRHWGHEGQKRLGRAEILVIGLGSCGAEFTKNCVLAGVKRVFLYDRRPLEAVATSSTMGLDAIDAGVSLSSPADEAIASSIRQLNDCVEIKVWDGVTELPASVTVFMECSRHEAHVAMLSVCDAQEVIQCTTDGSVTAYCVRSASSIPTVLSTLSEGDVTRVLRLDGAWESLQALSKVQTTVWDPLFGSLFGSLVCAEFLHSVTESREMGSLVALRGGERVVDLGKAL